jgi:hypothetical protein
MAHSPDKFHSILISCVQMVNFSGADLIGIFNGIQRGLNNIQLYYSANLEDQLEFT